MPGIIEEAYHSIKSGKALYILGGFGGAAKSLSEIFMGNKPRQLTNEYQFDTEYLKEMKESLQDKAYMKLDYIELFEFFKNYSMDQLAKNNGLDIDENRILFESTNIHELVFLLMKGLGNKFKI